MTDEQNEVMDIAQEECAEVIQAISKIRRFGLMSEHNGVTNKEHLEEEVGDLLCMIDLLEEKGLVDFAEVTNASKRKRLKLATWSKIGMTK